MVFPYSQKGSDGYLRRFEEYFPRLNQEGISFKVQDICLDEEYKEAFKGSSLIIIYFFSKFSEFESNKQLI